MPLEPEDLADLIRLQERCVLLAERAMNPGVQARLDQIAHEIRLVVISDILAAKVDANTGHPPVDR